jgi:hypothetical protein
MITADWVVTKMRGLLLLEYEWAAAYMAAAAEASRPNCHSPNNLPGAVESTIRQMKGLQARLSAADIRRMLFETLEYEALVMPIPDEAENIPLPVRPAEENPGNAAALRRQLLLTKYQDALDTIRHARTPTRLLNGQLMAIAAEGMEGNFHWMPAGPEQGKERSFYPKEKGGEGNTKDAFAYWLNRGGKEPADDSYMNCWEAVFFTAYRAELVTVQRLRLIHAKATQAARDEGEAAGAFVYFSTLMGALGLGRSAPLVAEIGLLPSPGDVVFIAEEHHVAVCVEITDEEGLDAVKVMSLWKHPHDGYSKLSVLEFGPLVEHARFAPCPFV